MRATRGAPSNNRQPAAKPRTARSVCGGAKAKVTRWVPRADRDPLKEPLILAYRAFPTVDRGAPAGHVGLATDKRCRGRARHQRGVAVAESDRAGRVGRCEVGRGSVDAVDPSRGTSEDELVVLLPRRQRTFTGVRHIGPRLHGSRSRLARSCARPWRSVGSA